MKHRYAMCINADVPEDSPQWPLDLIFGKVYKVLPPLKNDPAHLLRIVDESGEDYLYDADRFVLVELPTAAVEALEKIPA